MALTHTLAASGSTGDNTHDGVFLGGGYEALGVQFEVEAVGASPSVVWKAQGSLDGETWFDLGYVTDASDTIATSSRSATSVGKQVIFLSNPVARRYSFVRLVTSSNSAVTYAAEVFAL